MSPSVIDELDRILFNHDSDPMFLLLQQQDDLLHKALEMGKAYKLFTVNSNNVVFEERGYEVVKAGGFEQWLSKSSDGFRNTESSTPNIVQPTTTPKKKSEHTIWDKIKYISVIVGGLSALILALGKTLHWF